MKNEIKVRVTTIAMLIDYYDGTYPQWTIDTYARINATSDKGFIENFCKEYSGNGILDVKIIDSVPRTYEIMSLLDFKDITNNIESEFPKINLTVLTY